MRVYDEIRTTGSSSVYNKLRKYFLAKEGEINCDRCPYHRLENWHRNPHRSWKWRTRWRHQYKDR